MNAPTQDPQAVLNQISIARQPIVDARKTVVAYELFNRSQSAAGHSLASDTSLVLNAIVNSGAPFSLSNKDLFINAMHQSLAGAHWDFLNPEKTVIEVPPVAKHDAAAIEAAVITLTDLRAKGFRLSFHHLVVAPIYKAWWPLASFVKFDTTSVKPEQLGPLVAAIKARTSAMAVAEKVETGEQFEMLKTLGVDRFQGYWFSVPEVVKPRVLSPGQLSAVQLFNLVSKSAEIEEVESALKKDAALGVNLLRIINSAGVGLPQKVTSLRQAVMLMGYEKLTRWSAMLLATASPDQSSMISASAVVRGRLMELLAELDPSKPDTGSAFLVGLLSHIDRMLGIPMAQALEQLSLDDEVTSALLHGEGNFADTLALAIACESEDDAAFSAAFSKLHYSLRQINMAHLEALAWGDSVSE